MMAMGAAPGVAAAPAAEVRSLWGAGVGMSQPGGGGGGGEIEWKE